MHKIGPKFRCTCEKTFFFFLAFPGSWPFGDHLLGNQMSEINF